MSKYNQTKTYKPIPRVIPPRTVTTPSTGYEKTPITAKHHYAQPNVFNAAGGSAFKSSDRWELVSAVATALMKKDKYYESENELTARIRSFCKKMPEFFAKTMVWARTVLNLRSVSHIMAAELAYTVKGQPWTKEAHNAVLVRPDDVLEIKALYDKYAHGVREAHSMQKGHRAYIETLNEYQLAKYKSSSHEITLADRFNMLHPKPSESNESAFKKLIYGQLKNTDTWEARISAAGSNKAKRKEAWKSLLSENKLGYMAMLKNLRNMLEDVPELTDTIVQKLTNDTAVQKSRLLPFRFVDAYREIEISSVGMNSEKNKILNAIDQACAKATVMNVPQLDGNTLVALDCSGSMGHHGIATSPAGIGSLFAAIILKSNPNAEYMAFSNNASYVPIRTNDSLMTIHNSIKAKWYGGGTNFNSIFESAVRKYDNIIILTDNEGWMASKFGNQEGAPVRARRIYEQKFNHLPFMYVFDLAGDGNLMFPEDSVVNIAGISDHIFKLMRLLRTNRDAIIAEINAIDFNRIIAKRNGVS